MRAGQFVVCTIIIFTFYTSVNGQSVTKDLLRQADSLISAGSYDVASVILYDLKSKVNQETDSLNRVLLYMSLGKLYGALQLAKIDSSNYYLQLGESIANQLKNDTLVTRIYNLYGSNYLTIGNSSMALKYFTQMAELEKKSNDKSKLARTYYHLASVYHNEGHYLSALSYYDQSERLFNELLPPNHKTFGSLYNNKSGTYKVLGRYEDAMEHITKAIAIKEAVYPPGNPTLLNSYISQADIYLYYNKPDEALPFLNKILKYEDLQNDQVADGYGFMGRALAQKQQFSQSIYYHKKAADLYLSAFGGLQNWVPEVYSDISKVFREQQLYDSAFTYIQMAISSNHHTFKSISLDQNPEAEGSKNINGQINMLGEKGSALMEHFAKYKSKSSLASAYKTFEMVVKQIDNERKYYKDKEAILYLAKEVVNIYEGAITCAYEMYNQTKEETYAHSAFKWAEQSKSFLLLKSMNESEAENTHAINSDLKEKENKLLSEIKFYEQQKYKVDLSTSDSVAFTKQLFNATLRYDTLVSEIEASNPAYHQTKYNLSYATINDFRDQLIDVSEILLEYYSTKDRLFIFQIGKNGFEIKSQTIDSTFTPTVLAFRDAIMKREHEKYKRINSVLYSALIEPLNLPKSISKIIVVPHGVLNYLPFEIMFKPSSIALDELDQLDYLVKTYQIRYDYSATLALKKALNQTVQTGELNFLAFAPDFKSTNDKNLLASAKDQIVRSQVAPLLGAKMEAETAYSIFGGSFFSDAEATEQRFKEYAPKASILHLATHAIVDDSDPSISRLLFTPSADSVEDGLLHAFELFQMNLKADLVTLSACNTGFGKISEGEGVMSLGRAFAYAGVPTIVMSLWPAADQSTASVMTSFYENLKNGMDKDEALQQAKIKYLSQADNISADPYLWGGFVLFGDRRPLPENNPHYYMFAALGITILLLSIYLIRFRSPTFSK